MELYNSATTNASAITMNDILVYSVASITDICNNPIDINNVIVNSTNSGLSALTDIGEYTINYSYTDIHNMTKNEIKTLYVIDKSYPNIIFNNVFTGDDFTMSLSADTIDQVVLYKEDLYNYTVSAVTDAYHGDATVDFSIKIRNRFNIPLPISAPATNLVVTFETEDNSGNITTYHKNLTVTN